MIGSIDDIALIEQALLDRLKDIAESQYDVIAFPQDGSVSKRLLHPNGLLAVRFATVQLGESQTRQTDRITWTFEINIVSRYLYTSESNVGAYTMITRLIRGLHGLSLALPDGIAVDTNVSLADLVAIDSGIWTYVMTINIVAPYIYG